MWNWRWRRRRNDKSSASLKQVAGLVLLLGGVWGGLVGCAGIGRVQAAPSCTAAEATQIHIAAQTFKVSVAASDQARSRGLSGQPSLKPATGMWFVFPQPDRNGFWMPDMNFSIDLVWINPVQQVVGAITLHPCERQACSIAYPPEPVSYVLEVNAGEFAGQVGDEVRWTCRAANRHQ